MYNEIIVCKFGGSSVRKEGFYHKIKQIVEGDEKRRVIVISAPGRLGIADKKVTDLLILAYLEREKFDFWMDKVQKIFENLIFRLNVDFDIKKEMKKIKRHFCLFRTKSYLFSRGEYLSAKIFAKYLNMTFVDAGKLIKFSGKGKVKNVTYKNIRKKVYKAGKIIVPGFYGTNIWGKIKVMSRGGARPGKKKEKVNVFF